MTPSRSALAGLLLTSAAILLAACAGDADQSPSPSPEVASSRAILATQGVRSDSDEEIAYYTEVAAALDLWTGSEESATGRFVTDSGDTDWDALRRGGAGTSLLPVVAALQAIDPPPSYDPAHADLLAYYEERAEIDLIVGDAVAAEDENRFRIGLIRLNGQLQLGKRTLAPDLCRIVFDGDPACDR